MITEGFEAVCNVLANLSLRSGFSFPIFIFFTLRRFLQIFQFSSPLFSSLKLPPSLPILPVPSNIERFWDKGLVVGLVDVDLGVLPLGSLMQVSGFVGDVRNMAATTVSLKVTSSQVERNWRELISGFMLFTVQLIQ
ncbi:hypothetical protein LR48_Vigan08g022500 [Vigna angularis]|uniref:Uncharacterized protein n=1 Tax=Phaseolus angularis TaxID=3914 RepID=A0A0L9V2X6_PHAAN|nr:hypothetical protein LR48_Vigan08g022500 [Vigna angularis]